MSSLLAAAGGPTVPIVTTSSNASQPTLSVASVDTIFGARNVLDWGGSVSFPLTDCQGAHSSSTSQHTSAAQLSHAPITLHLNRQDAETSKHPHDEEIQSNPTHAAEQHHHHSAHGCIRTLQIPHETGTDTAQSRRPLTWVAVSDATDEALLNLERQYGVSAKHIKRGLEDHDPSSGYRHAQYLILHYDEVSRDTSRFTKQGASVTSSRCVLICKDGLLISVSKNVPASVARVWSELQSPDIEIQPPATSNALATRIIGSHLYGCEKTVSELSRDTDEYVERYSSKLPNAKDLKWTRSMTRNLSTCKQSVEALNPVIDRLQERRNFFGEPNAVEALERYQGITRSIKERIETTRQEVRNLDESWDSIYRNWQTKLVTYLALIGTGIAPVSLAAAIFGVNFRQMPSDTTMWLALGASALVSVGMIGAMLFSKKAAGR